MYAIFGQNEDYFWVEAPYLGLYDLVSAIPELVHGKRIAITSFDSGPFRPSSKEVAAGWQAQGSVAFSPVIRDVEQLPTGEYDEWYVGATWPAGFEPHVFINYGGFSLRDPAHLVEKLRPTWDRMASEFARDRILEQQAQFWTQLGRLSPISYLAEGDLLVCVTRDERLFERCKQWFHSTSL
jgi:hypothetical protein